MKNLYIFPLVIACLLSINLFAEEIKIGWVGPLTGHSAVLGVDGVEAAQLAIQEINLAGGIKGTPVKLIIEDDQYDTAKSIVAYKRLIGLGVKAIIMPSYGGVFAVDRLAQNDSVIIINPLDCNNQIAALSENIFCIATESESIADAIAARIQKAENQQVVGLIYDERNPFMLLVADSIKATLGKTTIKLFDSGIDQNAISDFRSILLKYKSKGMNSLILLGHDPMGQAIRQAKDLDPKIQMYTLGTITSPGYQELAGKAADGTLVAFWEAAESDELKTFEKNFTAKVGRKPILQLATIPSYDATKILLQAMDRASQKDSSTDAIRTELLAVKDYAGLSGKLSIDSDGAVRSIKENIYIYNSGKLTKE